MKNTIVAASVALALSACGGGGAADNSPAALSGPAAVGAASAPAPAGASPSAAAPAPASAAVLAVQAISRVNTTTGLPQVFNSIGGQSDGGYTVAWIADNSAVSIQRYDGSGNKVGGEVSAPLSIQAGPQYAGQPGVPLVIHNSSVGVLRDGSVVVVYEIDRLADAATDQFNQGVFFQRFDANGNQLSGETPVVSRLAAPNPRPVSLLAPQVAPLSGGGFVVAYLDYHASDVEIAVDLVKQRYDSQAQPVGGNVLVKHYSPVVDQTNGPVVGLQNRGSYALDADLEGGYTLTLSHNMDTLQNNVLVRNNGTSAIHFDAADTATEIVAQRVGNASLLPLAGNRFVRFTSDASGTVRQFLDATGNPVGDATGVASMPVAATELADGSFIVFTQPSNGFMAQRFGAAGAALGDAVAVTGIPSKQGGVAAFARGVALAWTPEPIGDGRIDTFTQQVLVQN